MPQENGIVETRTVRLWVGEDGIVRVRYFENIEETLEDAIENIQALGDLVGDRLNVVFFDYSNVKSQTRECRQYYASEATARVVSATAILVTSALSRVIANFFMGFNKPKHPTRIFISEEEAVTWLKSFLPEREPSI